MDDPTRAVADFNLTRSPERILSMVLPFLDT
jgi:hypothetical protein